jgi:hypothetical protein
MKSLTKKLSVAAAGVGAAVVSSASFAQASGVDVTATVTAINNVVPSLISIGGAVLAVVVVAWGYKVVRGFMGR